ncbi:hypothetical protein F66182_13508, partial [Fusarium sp. NRRL 66182]
MADTTDTQSHTEVDLESLEKHQVPQDIIDNNDDLQKPEEAQPPAAAAPPEAPEGGTKAWLSVLGASAALFTSFGWTNCIGLFQEEYQSNQLKEYSSSTVSWITSVQSLNVIPTWFDKKRGIAYGIAASGSSMGGIIFPIMVQKLIVRVGYGWSMRISAFMILGLLIIANLTIKSRLRPQPKAMTKDELVQPFREFSTVAVISGFVLLTFGIFIPIDYVVVEALGTGMDPNLAQYLLAMLNAG